MIIDQARPYRPRLEPRKPLKFATLSREDADRAYREAARLAKIAEERIKRETPNHRCYLEGAVISE